VVLTPAPLERTASGNQRHIRARLAGVQVRFAVEGLARQVAGGYVGMPLMLICEMSAT